ncbi:cytochrome c [Marimonas arenosa]|uniref:Cytochrome c n=1 Tax=Marimonas arenosa TaxID=1795305 RepID=A0AAE3WDY2_9RHOB|nr:cytochrome c [Marimonas arenosa]MDQ2090743.1 cytochrome c [Marimonas arenosa]
MFRPVSAPAAGLGLFPYTDPQAVALGEQLYAEYCAACHGTDLEGEPDWRVRDEDGYLPAPPHDATGHTWHHPDEQLFLITKHGTAALVGGDYQSRMMGFGDVLTDDDILAVLAYIKSTWPAGVINRHNQINAAQ